MFVDQTVQGVEVSGSNAGEQDFLTIFILWIFRVGQRRQIQRIGYSPGEGQEGISSGMFCPLRRQSSFKPAWRLTAV